MMRSFALPFLFTLGLIAGCVVDHAPSGLRRTPEGDGPRVKFDPAHRPMPEVPLPNDVQTFADPTSRTGLRIDVSAVAATEMDRRVRRDLSSMEGWGVSSPITVSFERPAEVDPRDPAIDLEAISDQMVGDDHDPSNDPFYVVNLSTGIPVLIDIASGYYPTVLRDRWRYFPNDPKAGESNLSFETTEEGPALPQASYRPDLDRDFDGVLDHPNTRTRGTRSPTRGVGDLLTWYERESDTLVLRPIVPLDEKTEYAVVLTDRLRGPNGKPVRSPFEAIHHPTQVAGITRLSDWLTDKSLANYYGDLAGTGLEHVAFAWTFTTQPTHEDLRILRDGLYGRGPFARWATAFPAELKVAAVAGSAADPQPAGWESSSDACKKRAATPLVVKLDDAEVKAALNVVIERAFGLSKSMTASASLALEFVDHIVLGSFRSPYLLGDPASRSPNTHFNIDLRTGDGDVHSDDVPWMLIVPKAKAGRRPPFPVALWNHTETGSAAEALLYAGDYARQGIAVIAYDSPGHGLVVDAAQRKLAESTLLPSCVVPLLSALATGRAHDLNGDGVADSGFFWWTANLFHTRDVVRQSVLDGMQLVRILRSFDGRRNDANASANAVAGDFDGDGLPDVGGPNVSYFASGRSLGGVTSAIQGGVEPYIIATAPISGGGSLVTDVAMRGAELAEAATGQLMGPFVFAVPATERRDDARRDELASRCSDTQRTVRLHVNDGLEKKELEIACLDPTELADGMTVVVTNVASREARCARTDKDGRFRIAIPTSMNDRLDVQIYNAPDVVSSYDGCRVLRDAPIGRRITSFEQAAVKGVPVASPGAVVCEAEEGCQQFRDQLYAVGGPLLAPNEGLGLQRQSPAFRRFRDLAQAAFDPADPVVFAPYYMLKPLVDETGARVAPHALLGINTIGDNVVPIAAGLSFARAAGALPFLPPGSVERFPAYGDYATPRELYDQLGRRSPMQFLVENGVVEGVARLGRTSAGPRCQRNYHASQPLCTDVASIPPADCAQALFDADWVSEGRLPFEQPHPEAPLRLARVATVHATDSTSLAAAWEPRLRGVPFAPDDAGWSATERVVAIFDHYLTPEGRHAWGGGDACRTWDYATYGNALIARFFASGGRDVYYLSHPKTHGCLVDATCDFLE